MKINIKHYFKFLFFIINLIFLHFSFITKSYADLPSELARLLNYGSVYYGCIFSEDRSDVNIKDMIVRPLGEACYNSCQQSCNAIYTPQYDASSNDDMYSYAINKDFIGECLKDCAAGINSGVKKRIWTGEATNEQYPTDYTEEISTDSTHTICSQVITDQSSAFFPYEYSEPLEMGSKVVMMINDTNNRIQDSDILSNNVMNDVSLCGYDTKYIYPKYYSTESKNWPKSINFGEWSARQNVFYNTGLVIKNGDRISINLEGRYLYYCSPSMSCSANNDHIKQAYNLQTLTALDDSSFTDYPKNIATLSDQNNNFVLPIERIDTNIYPLECSNNTLSKVEGDGCDEKNYNPSKQCCTFDKKLEYEKKKETKSDSANFNLKQSAIMKLDIDKFYQNLQWDNFNNSSNLWQDKYWGHKYNSSAYRSNTYYGNLKDFSKKFTSFVIRHYDGISSYGSASDYNDNIGGLNVTIDWAGCFVVDKIKPRIEYILLDSRIDFNNLHGAKNELNKILSDDTKWKEIKWFLDPKTNKYYSEEIPITKPLEISSWKPEDNSTPIIAKMYLRIKPLSQKEYQGFFTPLNCDSISSFYPNRKQVCKSEQEIMNDLSRIHPSNATGYWNISLIKKHDDDTHSGLIEDVIKKFSTALFGSSGNVSGMKFDSNDVKDVGIIGAMYKEITSDTLFMKTVKILLGLYISLTGLFYFSGLSEMNWNDALVRTIKVAIVLMLISDNSWYIFTNYFLVIFIDGTQELIQLFTFFDYVPDGTTSEIEFLRPMLGIFNELINTLFSSNTWKRIFSLLTNLIPFVNKIENIGAQIVGIVILLGAIFAIMACLRAFLIYLISIFGLSMMVIIAPLAICFILFQNTKKLFDNWWKQLLIYGLEPVAVFASVSFFGHIMLLLLIVSTNYTICRDCLFEFSIPVPFLTNSYNPNNISLDICIPTKWVPLFLAHTPDNLYSPILLFTSALGFFIIAHTAYISVDVSSSLVMQILNYSGASAGAVASFGAIAAPIYQGANIVKEAAVAPIALATRNDEGAVERQEAKAQKKVDKANKDLEDN